MRSLTYLIKSLNRRFKQWFEVPESYSTLKSLIKRAENRMKVKPLCPYCKSEMLFRMSSIAFGIPTRDDQRWKCPKCFHTSHFGIPITKDEYFKEYALRGGKILMRPSYRFDERERKDVLERLRVLGYLE